jgi:arylsulfatase A-like enzyme
MQFGSTSGSNQLKYFLYMLLVAAILGWIGGLKNLTKSIVEVTQKESVPVRPNILMIVVDDLGYDDISAINPGGIATPNIDEIAAEGTLFTRHYADSTCSPSRVAILTGRHPEKSGFRHRGIEIPPEYPTIAESLSKQGYATYLVGKWHAGEERRQGWPMNKGFDNWFGFLNQWQLAGDLKRKKIPTYHNPWLRSDGGKLIQYQGHLTDILTDHSVNKISSLNKSGQPWFLYHAFLAPHDPIQAASSFREKFPATPEGEYRALITQLDASIGRLLEVADDNTLVVFLSDNGGTNSRRNNNFPFYGKKNEVYEGSYRTPLMVKYPGVIPRQIVDDVVMNVDLYPTLLDAISAPLPAGLDGQSLWSAITRGAALENKGRSWEQYNWNIQTMTFSILSSDGRWRMSEMYGLNPMLYDLHSDRSGAVNMAEANPSRIAGMYEYYWKAHLHKSRLAVESYNNVDAAITTYTGFDTMRTPYMFGFSIGLEIPPIKLKNKNSQILAEQEGVWKLVYRKSKGIEWHIGDAILKGLNFNPNECNRIILTGDLQPGEEALAEKDSTKTVKLYSSGLLQELHANLNYSLPSDQSVSMPTKVYNNGTAIFLNTTLSSFSESFSPDVPLEHYQMFDKHYKNKKLSIPQISMLDDELCSEK